MASNNNTGIDNIRKERYHELKNFISSINAKTAKEVTTNKKFSGVKNRLNAFEKRNIDYIIEGIIDGCSINDIPKYIQRSIEKTREDINIIVNGKRTENPVDDIEELSNNNDMFMLHEQEVIEIVESDEPVNIIIGDEEIEEASSVIITEVINGDGKSIDIRFDPEADYGTDRMEYTKTIRELTIADFEKENKVAFDKTGWGTDEFLKEVSRRIYDYEIAHKLKEPKVEEKKEPEQKPQLRSIWAEALGSLPCFTVK